MGDKGIGAHHDQQIGPGRDRGSAPTLGAPYSIWLAISLLLVSCDDAVK